MPKVGLQDVQAIQGKKRSRSGCEVCRKRKIKCDEAHPICGQCRRKKVNCTYIAFRVTWIYQTPDVDPVSNGLTGTDSLPPTGYESSSTAKENPLAPKLVEVAFDGDDQISLFPDARFLRKFQLMHPLYGDYLAIGSSLLSLPTPVGDSAGEDDPNSHESQVVLHRQKDYPFFDDEEGRSEYISHFVLITSRDLVPVTYDENPFATLFPRLAEMDDSIASVLAAFGATHKAMMSGYSVNGSTSTTYKLLCECDVLLYDAIHSGPENSWKALLLATMLALLTRNNVDSWTRYMTDAVQILDSKSTEELLISDHAEENSVCMRLVVAMGLIGDLCGQARIFLSPNSMSWWPQWSGSLDYLTALDLNLAPLYTEASRLIEERRKAPVKSRRRLAQIYKRALFVAQRVNDYWLEEFWPYDDLTAMCILFQQALQIHVYRRLLGFGTDHHVVKRSIRLMLKFLDDLVPLTSPIQKNMTFIIVTAASEATKAEHRLSLILRMEAMTQAGYTHTERARREVERCWREGRSLIMDSQMHPVF